MISVQCPSTQTNGLLGREHERGGPMADGNRDIFIKTCKDRQRTSFEVLTEHLPAGSENETEPICALQHILLNCKIKSLLSLNGEKSHFRNKDTVWWCTLHVGNFFATAMQPFCVVVSKEQADFKCEQRIIMEEVSVTSDSYSTEQQLSLSLSLTFLDLPVFSVQCNLSSWMRYLLQVLWKSDYYKYWCLKKFIWQKV